MSQKARVIRLDRPALVGLDVGCHLVELEPREALRLARDLAFAATRIISEQSRSSMTEPGPTPPAAAF